MGNIRGSLLFTVFMAVAACSPPAAKQYLTPYVPPNKVVDANIEVFDPQADILFVIDNSGSMSTHQANLAKNIGLFTSVFLKKSVLDYNIGVISTDADGIVKPCCGQLVGTTRIVNKMTPNADFILQQNMKLGTSGSGSEKSFDPVKLALSKPLVETWNAGFLRPSASLIIIFITDAEDQSVQMTAGTLYNFLVDLKKGDTRKILAYGAIVPTGVTNCTRDSTVPPRRIEDFLGIFDKTKANVLSLCAADYGARLAKFAGDIVSQVSSEIFLSRAPVLSSIRVTYGSADLPMDPRRGWAFHPERNSLILGEEIDWSSQPNGSRIKVFYDAAHFEEDK